MIDLKKEAAGDWHRPAAQEGATDRRNFHPNSAEAQRQRILDALRHGPLTTLRARQALDVMHPAARVMELRIAGHQVITTWALEPTDCGRLHRVARYVLLGQRRPDKPRSGRSGAPRGTR